MDHGIEDFQSSVVCGLQFLSYLSLLEISIVRLINLSRRLK